MNGNSCEGCFQSFQNVIAQREFLLLLMCHTQCCQLMVKNWYFVFQTKHLQKILKATFFDRWNILQVDYAKTRHHWLEMALFKIFQIYVNWYTYFLTLWNEQNNCNLNQVRHTTGCFIWKVEISNGGSSVTIHIWPNVGKAKLCLRGGRFFQFNIRSNMNRYWVTTIWNFHFSTETPCKMSIFVKNACSFGKKIQMWFKSGQIIWQKKFSLTN